MSDHNIIPFPSEDSSKYQQILSHIENDPQHSDIVQQAQGEETNSKWHYFKFVWRILVTSPSELHGKALVTKEVKKQATGVAVVTTVSNVTDFALNWSLYFFLFKNLGALVALPASLAVNLLLLISANSIAAGVPQSLTKNKKSSSTALFLFILLNILQTGFSGIGSELLGNQPELRKMKAEELVVEERVKVEELKVTLPRLREKQQECAAGKRKLDDPNITSQEWNRIYVDINGTFKQRSRGWSKVDRSQLPVCVLSEYMAEEHEQKYQEAEEKLERRVKAPNEVTFLQNEYPAIYAEAFTDEGELKSSVDALRLATLNLFGKISSGQIYSLGYTLLLLSISIVTSIASIGMMLAYIKREDVQLSFDEELRIERDEWLQSQCESMERAHQKQLKKLDIDPDL